VTGRRRRPATSPRPTSPTISDPPPPVDFVLTMPGAGGYKRGVSIALNETSPDGPAFSA